MTEKKVLIVDDEPTIRDVLSQMLEISDYQTCTAVNGAEGLQVFNEQKPDLVITDVLMPVMDGHEFCRGLREVSDVPIMMLSGQVDLEDEDEKRKRMGLNISAVMTKPIQMMEFLNAVGGLLGNSNAEQTAVA